LALAWKSWVLALAWKSWGLALVWKAPAPAWLALV
jgi:hypothetical protein